MKRIVSKCVVCRCLEGKAFREPMTADLSEFRLQGMFAFTTVGIDYLGPLITKAEGKSKKKVWVCLFSCNMSRAIHLEIVPDFSTEAFLHCLQSFTARHGIPRLTTSDNTTNFKGASKILLKLIQTPEVQAYLVNKRITWRFLLQKALWHGRCFMSLVKLVKRTSKKIL